MNRWRSNGFKVVALLIGIVCVAVPAVVGQNADKSAPQGLAINTEASKDRTEFITIAKKTKKMAARLICMWRHGPRLKRLGLLRNSWARKWNRKGMTHAAL